MPAYKVTFYPIKNPNQIQRETITLDSVEEVEELYANTGHGIIDIEPKEPVIVDEEAEQIEIGEIIQWLEPAELCPNLSVVQSTQRVNMLVASGAVNPDGSLKPYVTSGHRSTPMTLEELGDDGIY